MKLPSLLWCLPLCLCAALAQSGAPGAHSAPPSPTAAVTGQGTTPLLTPSESLLKGEWRVTSAVRRGDTALLRLAASPFQPDSPKRPQTWVIEHWPAGLRAEALSGTTLRVEEQISPLGPTVQAHFRRGVLPVASLVTGLRQSSSVGGFGLTVGRPTPSGVSVQGPGTQEVRLKTGQTWRSAGRNPTCVQVLSLHVQRADYAEAGRPPAVIGAQAALLLTRPDPATGCR